MRTSTDIKEDFKWWYLLKVMTNLDSILKSRDITLPTNDVRLVKVMVFPIVMYGCELDYKES